MLKWFPADIQIHSNARALLKHRELFQISNLRANLRDV